MWECRKQAGEEEPPRRHVIHLIKIECSSSSSSFDVQRLRHECTSGQAYQCWRMRGYRYRSWRSATLIYAASVSQERAVMHWGRGAGSRAVQAAAGNCRFCELSSIKLSENKLHNIMAKWAIKVCDAHSGLFVLSHSSEEKREREGEKDTKGVRDSTRSRAASCILWGKRAIVASSNQSSITIKSIRNYALN